MRSMVEGEGAGGRKLRVRCPAPPSAPSVSPAGCHLPLAGEDSKAAAA